MAIPGTEDGETPGQPAADDAVPAPFAVQDAEAGAEGAEPPPAEGAPQPGFEPPQLAFGDDEVRLPWLEADEEEFEEPRGLGMGQGLLLALSGLVAVGLIIGGLLWATRDKAGEQLVADGGVIAAPKEPYKVKPENPGGEVVAGTGDTSFAVAEGQSRQVRIDGKDKAPVDKVVDTAAARPAAEKASATPVARPSAAAAAPAPATSGGVGVQVGAYSSKTAAEAGWNALKAQYPALSGVSHRVLQGQADIGTVYRLQAVPGDRAAARALCSGMKGAGLSCQVKD